MADAGVHIGRSDEQFSAVLADPRTPPSSASDEPCPLLRVERHTYDLVGRPIEVVEARYNSERYTVTAESIRSRELNRRTMGNPLPFAQSTTKP